MEPNYFKNLFLPSSDRETVNHFVQQSML